MGYYDNIGLNKNDAYVNAKDLLALSEKEQEDVIKEMKKKVGSDKKMIQFVKDVEYYLHILKTVKE